MNNSFPQHLEQLRNIYDQHDLIMILIGILGIEKKNISLSETLFKNRVCI